MSKNFLLDDDYNFKFENNNIVLGTGVDTLVDRLRMNLSTFQGEWFLDANLGIPYIQQVFKKPVNVGALYTIFSSAIRSTEGVKSLTKLEFDTDKSERKLSISFSVVADDNTQLEDTIALEV